MPIVSKVDETSRKIDGNITLVRRFHPGARTKEYYAVVKGIVVQRPPIGDEKFAGYWSTATKAVDFARRELPKIVEAMESSAKAVEEARLASPTELPASEDSQFTTYAEEDFEDDDGTGNEEFVQDESLGNEFPHLPEIMVTDEGEPA